jgi:hypothetical protein
MYTELKLAAATKGTQPTSASNRGLTDHRHCFDCQFVGGVPDTAER